MNDIPSHAATNTAAGEPITERKPLPPAAIRALAEAEERRIKAAEEARNNPAAKELQGPQGLEPTRFGDWERKGIASDF